MSGDHLQRLLLEEANVRCVVVHLDAVYREVLGRGCYPDLVAQLLGQTLVVSALCSSGVKFSGRISLQLRSSSALKLLMADCTDQGGLRGLARFDADAILGASGFSDLTAGGVLTMTVEPSDKARTWQGIVPLEAHSMSAAIEAYFERSEQLPTRVMVAVQGDRAAGVLIQRLPGKAEDDDGWNRVCRLLETLGEAELLQTASEELLHRLFHAEDRRLYPARPLRFFCPCSRERVARVLRGLGEQELEEIIESQGEVEVNCEFCDNRYCFDPLDIQRLLHSDLPEDTDGRPTFH
ncbi:MAG: Hsp33 family molecular chaperone HslO [Xanthomonadaceae bacterium]|nr:Hsp33 family molecular chaperone HslO [Xanthomonadaceae bacterium]